MGRVEEVRDANNNPTARYAYGITTHVTVDSFNKLQRTTITDANNHITSQFNNSRGQLVLVREFTGTGSTANPVDPYVHLADTRYRYDLFGHLLRVGTSDWTHGQPIDSSSYWLRATTMTYDAFGRKTGMTDPDMGTWLYSYDAASNLTRQQDAKGQVLCFFYDNLDRITSQRHDSPVNGCSVSDNLRASYSYFGPGNGSSSGQVSEIRWPDVNNRETFTYNPKGLLSTHTRWIDGNSYSLTYGGYDLLNRPTSLTYPNQEVVTMGYDREGENNLSITSSPYTPAGSLVNGVTYNEQGQLAFLDRASFDTDYTYWPLTGGTEGNNNGRLYTIQHGATTDTLPDFKYLYDNVGNIKTLETWVKPGASHLIDTQTFTYDELNRLESANGSGYNPEMIAYSQTYAYDRLGNIDERQEKTCNPTCGPLWNVYDYSYGSKPQAVTSVGGQGSYSYDTNGNMSSRTEGGITYTQVYDVENRLVSVMGGGSSTTFAYDASGQRVKTMATTPGNSRTITYYPFPNYEEEQQQTWYPGVCFATCPGSWMTDVTVKRSLYGLAGQAIATRVVSNPAQGTDGLFYFLGDHLGSTRLLTNTSGTPIAGTTAHFLPYGSYRGDEPVSEITDTGFTGHKHNDSLGLVYMNARFYVPGTGRFLTADTIVPDPTNPQSHNRYSYVRNNPLSLIDPTGHNDVCLQAPSCAGAIPTPVIFPVQPIRLKDLVGTALDLIVILLTSDSPIGEVNSAPAHSGAKPEASSTPNYAEDSGTRHLLSNSASPPPDPNDNQDDNSEPQIGKRVKTEGVQVSGRFPRTAQSNQILYRADNSGNITNYQVYGNEGQPLMRVDIAGSAHGGVPTPHVLYFEQNIAPNGTVYFKPVKMPIPATSGLLP